MNEFIEFATPVAMIVLLVMQGRAASKADLVKTTLETSSQHRDEKLKEIHDLVNSRMTEALKKIAELQKELCTLRSRKRKQKTE